MMEKSEIRKLIFQKRKEASTEYLKEASEIICKKIISLEVFQQANTIYAYMDCRNEVMTAMVIEDAWRLGKKVAVPKVEGKEMNFYLIDSYDNLKLGNFQIREPENCPKAEDENALMIMPGVAFDTNGHRIGYGGGYYDRYLAVHKQLKTAAVAFDFQMLENLPTEPTDILPQMILTETKTLKF